jgi:hypothetical protein
MKKIAQFFLTLSVLVSTVAYSQNVAINTTGAVAVASAMLDITSTTSGVLIPRMTQVQRNAIAAPATSLLIYQTDNTPGYYYYNGTTWVPFLTSTTGWSITGNVGTNPATNFLGTTDNQALVFRTNNTERMRILGTGFIGIGTTTPTYNVDVILNNASGYIASFENTNANNSSLLGLKNTGTFNAIGGASNPSNGVGVYGVAIAGNPSSGYGVYGVSNSSNALGVRGSIPTTGSWLGFGGYFTGGLAYANGIYNVSDESVKKEIYIIKNALQKIMLIEGISFKYDEKSAPLLADDKRYLGFSAQNISNILPEAVAQKQIITKEKFEKYGYSYNSVDSKLETKLVVDYTSIIPVLVEAIKEQQLIIEQLNIKINSLESTINNLR